MKILILFTLILIAFQGYSQQVFNTSNDTTITPQIIFLEVSDSTLSDILVYRVDSINKIYKDGLWFELSSHEDSYFNYKITSDTSNYDMKIYFVNMPKNAAWINRDKRLVYINAKDN